jgi:hypothetical protein
VLMRRKCLEGDARFDQGIKWVEDWWFWIQLSRTHRFFYLPQALARYRVHSMSTNVVQKRGYCINRFKVYRRVLQQFPELPNSLRARVLFEMGVDLCAVGKLRRGRSFFWSAAIVSMNDLRAWGTFCRALRRLVLTRFSVQFRFPRAGQIA